MIFSTIQRSLHSKSIPILYEKLFYSAPLRYHFTILHGNILIQKDVISMGSVLWTMFSNFYISALENKVFNIINKPNIYLRYADDILILNDSTHEINTIQETFQNNSVLNFLQEININNKISFLGVLIDTSNIDRFITSTYKKPTNINSYTLNFQSECPFRYKRTIMKNTYFQS